MVTKVRSSSINDITSAEITAGLGFTPYNATNPSGYITGINSTAVTTALGFTPYNATNPSGYITGITSGNVITALGFTPANASSIPTKLSQLTNDSGFITGINSTAVTNALGFTPYNSTNPSSYVNAAGASAAAPVQSVNGFTGSVNLDNTNYPTKLNGTGFSFGYPGDGATSITLSNVNLAVIARGYGTLLMTVSSISYFVRYSNNPTAYCQFTNQSTFSPAIGVLMDAPEATSVTLSWQGGGWPYNGQINVYV